MGELRSILGLLNFYRCYLPHFSTLAAPLNKLLGKDAAFEWGPEQEAALQQLKDGLTAPGVGLRHPDPQKPCFLHTDWSINGISGVLSQQDEKGDSYLVASFSRSNNKHEKNYPAYKGEILAAVSSI